MGTHFAVDWDHEAIIRVAGGPASLRDLLKANNIAPPAGENTLYKWASRGQIPARWLATCVYVVLKERKPPFAELLIKSQHPDATYRKAATP